MPLIKGEVVKTTPKPAPQATPPAPVVAPKSPGAIKTSIEPDAPAGGVMPTKINGPPVPILQKHNYHGSIQDFNARVEAAHSAYQEAYGIPPNPGLLFDVAKSSVPTNQFASLFTVPVSQQSAKARAVVNQAVQGHFVDMTALPPANAADTISGLAEAVQKGNYATFLDQHHDAIEEALNDPRYHDEITRASLSVAMRNHLETVGPGNEEFLLANRAEVLRSSVVPDAGNILGTALMQIAGGLVLGPPVLVFKEGQAIARSVGDKSLDPLGKTNAELGKAIYHGTGRDIHHPAENPGNLFLDLFGLASLGAGAAARVAAAGRLAAAGEGAAATSRALVRRPAPGTHTVRLGDTTAESLLSDNALVRALQRTVLNQRQAGMDVRHDLAMDDVPAGAQTAVFGDRVQGVVDGLSHPLRSDFGYENKLGRTIRAENRVEQAVRMAVADPVVHATNLSVRMTKLGPRVERGLNVGEEKALQVLLTDVAGGPTAQIAVNRAFHERLLNLGIGDPEAHRAQLAALELAKKVLSSKPRPKFTAALGDVRRLIDEQDRLKIQVLGLDPTSAESRVARVGAILRDEPTLEPAYLSDPIAQAHIADLESKLAENATLQENYKSAPRSAERAAGGATEGLAPDATLRSLRLEESELRNRVDALKADQKPIALARVNPESRYLDYASASKRRGAAGTFYGPTIGPFGIPVPGSMPELNHVFTGYNLQAGDFRVDATGLAGESYGRTVRAITKYAAWKKLHGTSVEKAPTGKDADFYRPIRDVKAIPEKLRPIVDKAPTTKLTSEEALLLSEGDLDNLEKFLMPKIEDLTPEELAGVRWFDSRVMADTQRAVPGAVGKRAQNVFTAVNEPIRDLMIYGKPSYILNALNSAGMAVIEQGAYAVPNIFKALTATSRYGAEATRMLDGMAGESRTQSYAFDTGKWTKGSRALASGWNRITDLYFRRSAVIHWLHRLGVEDDAIPALLRKSLSDPEAMKIVSEASRRGKKSMVELDNLTPFEKDQVRHFVFVYPWVSRSAIWSLRTILEHPVQSAVFAQIGKETEEEFPQILKRLPEYMKRSGYFPVGWTKDGKPKLVNPGSVNTFATLTELAGVGSGKESIESLLGPGAELAVHLVTNRDQWGRSYQTPVIGPLTDMVAGLPQYAAFKRANQKTPGAGNAPMFTAEGPEFYDAAFAHNKRYAKPGPYETKLSSADEETFRAWVTANKVPFDPNAKIADYDMRGFWKSGGKWTGGDTHFPDTFKTPYDTSFSRESQYATADNPLAWNGNTLVDTSNGRIVFGPKPEPGAGLDLTNDRALVEQQNARTHGAGKEPMFIPEGFWRSFWPLAVGGLHAKVLNTEAVNARFWRDAPIAERQANEKRLIDEMITLQGKVLKRPVPHEVLDAVNLASDLSLKEKQFADEIGHNPTHREQAQMRIDFLKERKLVDDKTAASLHRKLDSLPSGRIDEFKTGLMRNYAGGKEYAKWHDDVRTVASFTPDGLAYQVKALRALGVDDSKNLKGTDFDHLHELGRRYLDYQKTVAAMQADVTKAHGVDKDKKQAALSLFIEQADTPVKIDGHSYPSLPRLDIARMQDDQRMQMVKSLATRSWGGLNSLEKTLVGRPVDPLITQAWDGLRVWKAEAQAGLAPGEHLPSGYDNVLVTALAKKVPGFRQDYEFSQMPLAQRLQRLPKIAPADNRELWDELLRAASQRYDQMKEVGWDDAGISSYWQHNDAPQVTEWLKSHPTFKKEVDSMGTDFVYGLAS